MARCISNLKKQSCIRYSKRRKFRPKCVRMRLAAGLRPDPLGKLERSPRPSSRNWGRMPTSKGREGKGMGKGKEGGGKGKGRKERADPRPGLRKCKGGNPKVWVSANYAGEE